jgi:thiol-disulfide isomerase/thioredoxin
MSRTLPVVLLVAILGVACPTRVAVAEESTEEPLQLLGSCSIEQLRAKPFGDWFNDGYDAYVPAAEILQALRVSDLRGVKLQLFFGSWCGDSRREVPRLLRLFDEAGIDAAQVELIAVDRGDGVHKQAPGHEERGLEIYRVPTLVVKRGELEVARIVEFPVLSLERDLLAILSGGDYEPNYRSYPIVRRWLARGLLSDANVSTRGLAQQLQGRVAYEGELAAAAWVMLERGDVAEGLKLMEVNAELHGSSAHCMAGVAEARLRAGDGGGARSAARRALELNTDPERVAELVELLERSEE